MNHRVRYWLRRYKVEVAVAATVIAVLLILWLVAGLSH